MITVDGDSMSYNLSSLSTYKSFCVVFLGYFKIANKMLITI